MKLTLLITLTLIAVLCMAAEYRRPKHEAVVLQVYPSSGNYSYSGFVIVNASVSSGVEPIPVWNWSDPDGMSKLDNYAQKLADLLDQGFQIKSIAANDQNGYSQTITLVK